MSDSSQNFNLLRSTETAAKYAGLLIGTIYFVGFLVVAAHLSRYGVSGFSVLQLQYLIAGHGLLARLSFYSLSFIPGASSIREPRQKLRESLTGDAFSSRAR